MRSGTRQADHRDDPRLLHRWGRGLALACDIRFADNRARFAITPAKLGLVYSLESSKRSSTSSVPRAPSGSSTAGSDPVARACGSDCSTSSARPTSSRSRPTNSPRPCTRAQFSVRAGKGIVDRVVAGQRRRRRNDRDPQLVLDTEDYTEGVRAFVRSGRRVQVVLHDHHRFCALDTRDPVEAGRRRRARPGCRRRPGPRVRVVLPHPLPRARHRLPRRRADMHGRIPFRPAPVQPAGAMHGGSSRRPSTSRWAMRVSTFCPRPDRRSRWRCDSCAPSKVTVREQPARTPEWGPSGASSLLESRMVDDQGRLAAVASGSWLKLKFRPLKPPVITVSPFQHSHPTPNEENTMPN